MPATRYAAFLRGISPMNAKMPELKRCFEAAGFTAVRTLLSSGNVVFSGRKASETAVQRRAEAAMQDRLGHKFLTIVRTLDDLRAILDADPYAAFRARPGAKRVVTFLRGPAAARVKIELPIELDGARILCRRGREVFTDYIAGPRGPVFMSLIEKTFGKQITTRTWDTVRKVVGEHKAAARLEIPG